MRHDVRCSYVIFFKDKTAYEMRISDWSSDVCSSDLGSLHQHEGGGGDRLHCGLRECFHRGRRGVCGGPRNQSSARVSSERWHGAEAGLPIHRREGLEPPDLHLRKNCDYPTFPVTQTAKCWNLASPPSRTRRRGGPPPT